jgi:sugar phosphate isomerase/epimerase
MKISLSNGIFANLKLHENLAAIKRLGFDNVEFNMKSVQTEHDTAAYQAKKLLADLDLHCLTLHAATFPVTDPIETHRAVYYSKISADFAHELEAETVVIHSSIHRNTPPAQRKTLLARIYNEVTPYTRKLGLNLALENLAGNSHAYGKDPAELNEILNAIPCGHEVGITLDTSHAAATGNMQQFVDAYHDRLRNVHISNPKHQPITEQTPELDAFITELKRYGYRGPLTIELSPKCTSNEIQQTKLNLQKTFS